MTYYEEFGLDGTASVQEIRHAYRRLARLIHPDRCGEESTRRLAELQMRRLNAVLAVLTDAGQRAAYDESIASSRALCPTAAREGGSGRWEGTKETAWWAVAAVTAVAILTMVALVWRSPAEPPAVALPGGPAPAAVQEPATPSPARRLPPRAPVRLPVPPRRAAPQALDEDAELPLAPQIAKPAEPLRMEIARPVVADAPRVPGPAVATLAGEWFYVAGWDPSTRGLYPPEFIELRITEDGGWVAGRYRARYRVTDRAVSSTVGFQFAGPGEAEVAHLPWVGAAGARGDVTLRLVAPNALEVAWAAEELGRELGLASGKATLVRKIQ